MSKRFFPQHYMGKGSRGIDQILLPGGIIVPNDRLSEENSGAMERIQQSSIPACQIYRPQQGSARTGTNRLFAIANPRLLESTVTPWEMRKVSRLSQIMGRQYDSARMAFSVGDTKRKVPVLQVSGDPISGFHQAVGETTTSEFLALPIPPSTTLPSMLPTEWGSRTQEPQAATPNPATAAATAPH